MPHFRSHRQRLPIALLVVAACAFLVPIAMRAGVARYTYSSIEEAPQSDVALVLGASVVRGAPSPILAERADEAIDLYREGKVSKILVTGDSSALPYDEVIPVRNYLIDAGIPARDIFLDHAGLDTYSSIYRAREVFHVRSVTIVTQDFHLPRALWIARHLGLSAYGVIVKGGGGSVYDYIREIPASIKAFFNVTFDRKPRYSGPAVPLGENGENTWD
ncbi:MAG: ElyC/SanA/YdcF family protein [Patescibacteria group bacterium]